MRWRWDEAKNVRTRQKHKLSFEIASHVFNDPMAVSRPDLYPYEERWQTIGMIGQLLVLVVHTTAEVDTITGEETGRIVSARKATLFERKSYEENNF